MRREKLTLAQISERHDCWVAVQWSGTVCGFEAEPTINRLAWYSSTGTVWTFHCYEVTDAPADWLDSLTPPPMRPVKCDMGHEPEIKYIDGERCWAECHYDGEYEIHKFMGYEDSKEDLIQAWNRMHGGTE